MTTRIPCLARRLLGTDDDPVADVRRAKIHDDRAAEVATDPKGVVPVARRHGQAAGDGEHCDAAGERQPLLQAFEVRG
jgi:hypothetical protein